MESVTSFKKSCYAVSKAIKRIGTFMPCARCGKIVRRYPSQRAQAKRVFCSKTCKVLYYQALNKPANQRAFGVSLPIAQALVFGGDPWVLSKKEAAL